MPSLRTSWVERDTFRYPMQFFNPMSFVAPDIKSLFKWCEFFALSDPMVQSVIYKASAYPVTDIIVSSKDPKISSLFNEIIEHIELKQICIVANMHLNIYGNAFVTVEMPFSRKLICESCKTQYNIEDLKRIGLSRDYRFVGICPKEERQQIFSYKDIYISNLDRLKVVLWNPTFIDIETPFATARPKYMYNVKEYMADKLNNYQFDVLLAAPPGEAQEKSFLDSKRYLSDIPGIFLDALRTGMSAVFNNDLILHAKEPDTPGWNNVWGKPPLVASLRDLYFYYVIRKSIEVLIKERTLPYRFLFPRSVTGDPALEINLANMRNEIIKMLREMEFDPNIIGFLPIPYELATIGGDAHALLPTLTNILEYLEKRIIVGMGFPLEFAYGGMQWSGSSVSLRMLENLFINRRYMIKNILQFVKRVICITNQIDPSIINLDFSDMRMADDVARQRLLLDLVQNDILPDNVLLEDIGYHPDDIVDEFIANAHRKRKIMKETARVRAEAQAEAAKLEAELNPKMQYKMQLIIHTLQAPPEEIYSLPPQIVNLIYQLMLLSKEDRDAYLGELKETRPGLYNFIKKYFKQYEKKSKQQVQPESQMQSELPEQRPPRRQNEKKMV
ncbi:MAG: hypothetical protein QXP66_01805 [Candidatus Aenigmatarchaeota archaeon]